MVRGEEGEYDVQRARAGWVGGICRFLSRVNRTSTKAWKTDGRMVQEDEPNGELSWDERTVTVLF